jgi:NADPH:quinone reductase-like Zn-dependent oxidoreductase
MRAAVPDGRGSVVLADVAEPPLVRDEVLVAVEAYSVNRGETFLLEAPPPGWRPGKDVAGTVVATGSGSPGFGIGQRVVAHPEHSGWAELVAVPPCRPTGPPGCRPGSTRSRPPRCRWPD